MIKKLLFCFCTIVGFFASSSSTNAIELYNYAGTSIYTFGEVGSNYQKYWAESYSTTTNNYCVTDAKINLKQVGGSATDYVYFNIMATGTQFDTGTSLGTSSMQYGDDIASDNSYPEYTFTFSPCVPIGTTPIWFWFKRTGAPSSSNYYAYKYGTTGPTSGLLRYKKNDGTYSTPTNWDARMKINANIISSSTSTTLMSFFRKNLSLIFGIFFEISALFTLFFWINQKKYHEYD